MFKYILKRILLFLPTLFVISLLSFWLGKIAPGDPVEACNAFGDDDSGITGEAYEAAYRQLGLDKPLFYIAFSSAAFPDTLHKIPGRYRQESLSKLIDQYGNWGVIQTYNNRLEALCQKIEALPDRKGDKGRKIKIRQSASFLLEQYKDASIKSHLQKIKDNVLNQQDSFLMATLGPTVLQLEKDYQAIKNNPTAYKRYIPSIKWQGFNNQYHDWFFSFLKGDFGISCRTGQPVLDRIRTPIFWTLIINLITITLVYILAVPLGVFSAVKKDTLKDKIVTTTLFFLYSLPTFWVGTMLLVFFTNPEYGMNWFEGAGLGDLPTNAPFWDRFWETARHLILPVFCMTYGSLAFMSRQMRGGMLEILNQDYIRTARAKGLTNTSVIWRHAFRNALFPLITLLARIFPAAIAGALIIEVVFNIPGMGREVITAISSKDWPVLYTILMLVAILTMLGNLVADILYVYIDPRVKFK